MGNLDFTYVHVANLFTFYGMNMLTYFLCMKISLTRCFLKTLISSFGWDSLVTTMVTLHRINNNQIGDLIVLS